MTHSLTDHRHIEPNRIFGLAAAIALNTALLMLLLVPMRAPPSPPLPTIRQVIQWITPTPIVKPVVVPVVKPAPQAHGPVIRQHPATPPVAITTNVASNDTIAPPIDNTGTGDTIQEQPQTGPISSVRLEYDVATAPEYPRDALREGVQGTVMLRVLVDVDGRPLQVDIQNSSGDRRLDIAARKQVLQHWRFRPAMKDGRPVQAIGLVPIAFNLNG